MKTRKALGHVETPLVLNRWNETKTGNKGITLQTLDGRAVANIVMQLDDSEFSHAEFIVRAVNSHEELLEAAKNARNVLAGLVTGDLKAVKADSPALQSLRDAIAKAEGK